MAGKNISGQVASFLKRIREKRGISQLFIARQVEPGHNWQSTLSRIEAGKERITVDMLVNFLVRYNLTEAEKAELSGIIFPLSQNASVHSDELCEQLLALPKEAWKKIIAKMHESGSL